MAEPRQSATGSIVVGIDGSPEADAALRWAVRQAKLTGAEVEAVLVWHYPAVLGGYAWEPIAAAEAASFGEQAARIATSVLAGLDLAANVKIRTVARKGNPAQVLLDESDGADLLVLGSHSHRVPGGALLGSVSQHCAAHARCPVVIVSDAGQ